MYLQLADNDPYSHLAEIGRELYIFVPQGYKGAQQDMYIREDALDGLDDYQFQQIMFELEPYQNQGMSSKSSRAERRGARKDKKELKANKAAKKGGGARRDAKQLRVETRQKSKVDRQAKGGGFLDKIGGIATGIFGAKDSSRALDVSVDGGAVSVDVTDDDEPTFFQKYQTPLMIGGAVLIVGGIYLATRPKKR